MEGVDLGEAAQGGDGAVGVVLGEGQGLGHQGRGLGADARHGHGPVGKGAFLDGPAQHHLDPGVARIGLDPAHQPLDRLGLALDDLEKAATAVGQRPGDLVTPVVALGGGQKLGHDEQGVHLHPRPADIGDLLKRRHGSRPESAASDSGLRDIGSQGAPHNQAGPRHRAWPLRPRSSCSGKSPGGAEGSRTPDLVIANDALYQLSYGPEPGKASARHRSGAGRRQPNPRGLSRAGGSRRGGRLAGRGSAARPKSVELDAVQLGSDFGPG